MKTAQTRAQLLAHIKELELGQVAHIEIIERNAQARVAAARVEGLREALHAIRLHASHSGWMGCDQTIEALIAKADGK